MGVTCSALLRCGECGAPPRLAGAIRLASKDQHHVDGDPCAGFEEVYLAHRTAIYGHVRRMIMNEEDAEDLTVTVFEKALRAWDRRPPENEMRPWLFRIATNSCLDELRRRKRIQWSPWEAFTSLFHPSQVAPDDPEREAIRAEKADMVHSCLARLSPRDRAALVMRECYGLSNEEVAKVLGTTRDGAKMTLFRARERLRAIYLQMGGDLPEGRTAATGRAARAHRGTEAAQNDSILKDSQ